MKINRVLILMAAMCLSDAGILSGLAEAKDSSGSRNLLAEEHLGPFRRGLPSKEVTSLLGAPEQLTIGEQSEEWNYPRKGIRLTIGKDSMGAWVKQISITAPAKYESARGARIGMPWADVQKLYSDWTNPPGFYTNWFWVGNLKAGLGFEVVNEKIARIVLGEAPPECIEPTIGGSNSNSNAGSKSFEVQHFSENEMQLVGAQCELRDDVGVLAKAKWGGVSDTLWLKINGKQEKFKGPFKINLKGWNQTFESNGTTVELRLKRTSEKGELVDFAGTIHLKRGGQAHEIKATGQCGA